MDVLGSEHDMEVAVLLDDMTLAQRRGDYLDHYFFLVTAPEGA